MQVAAFSASNKAMAEKYKAVLESKTDLNPTLVYSEDGKYIQVTIGEYPDRAAALLARDKLVAMSDEVGRKTGFKDCFKDCFVPSSPVD
ncbi:MAG TPA: SPOR domain-containing protein [Candidatus Hydrogenedentes bacterium]|nr:SPOR domain-containing protein [Candidatus Hydrogenedentota bacterium]HIJ73906.1 SPOR domain-containing protein [Candidatus Hydrogenedentota bacterium]